MNGMGILKALNWVDDEYLEEMNEVKEKGKDNKRKAIRIVLIAALVSLLGFGTFASTQKLPYGWFYHFFAEDNRLEVMGAITESQQQMLKRGLVEINESMTKDGWTVTLESGITDGYRLLLKYRIDAPEGIVLEPYMKKLNVFPIIKTVEGRRVDCAGYDRTVYQMPDDNPNDNSITEVLDMNLMYTHDAKLFTCEDDVEWTLEISGISEYGENSEWESWNFFVPLGEPHMATEKIVLNKKTYYSVTATEDGREFEVKLKVLSFELRALTASVTLESIDNELLGFENASIVLKDGTEVIAWCSAYGRQEDGTLGLILAFDQPVLMSDVAYIEFP